MSNGGAAQARSALGSGAVGDVVFQAATAAAARSAMGILVAATPQTASGTAITFTGIPSTAKRITIPLAGLSTNGTSNIQVQIGDSGGPSGTGYLGSVTSFALSTLSTSNLTSGFPVTASVAAATILHGCIVLTLLNSATNTWVSSSMVGSSDTTGTQIGAGSKSLSGTLDRVVITTTGGVNTFDAGTVGLYYE